METKKFIYTKTFNLKIEKLFSLFTNANDMQNWFGPAGFKMTVPKMEFLNNGIFHYKMETPDGNVMWGKFVYKEIMAPYKIVCIDSFSDENEGVTAHPLSNTWPLQILSSFTFSEQNNETTLTVEATPYNASEIEMETFNNNIDSMKKGWDGTINQLADYINKNNF